MFCGYCGKEIADDMVFCPSCGKRIAGAEPNNSNKNDASTTQDTVIIDAEKDKNMAIVGYITWIGFIIAMCSDSKKSSFTSFHLNQALVLNLLSFVTFVPFIGWFAGIGVFVLWIMALISAANSEINPLPIVGSIKLL